MWLIIHPGIKVNPCQYYEVVGCWAACLSSGLGFCYMGFLLNSFIDDSLIDLPDIACECDAPFIGAFSFHVISFVESYYFSFFPRLRYYFRPMGSFYHGL